MGQGDLLIEMARFVERVTATAKTGLAFKPDGYDHERYSELLQAAARMHAALAATNGESADALVKRWRAEVVAGFDGYVTPATGVGVIAFNPRDELLMIKRINGRWWFPGGFCDVGLTPAENAAKEALEETGLCATPLHLMAVRDSLRAGSAARHIYSFLFYCRVEGGLAPSPLETLDAGFFALDSIPRPLHGNNSDWIEQARQFHFEGRREAFFDRSEPLRD